MIDSTDSEEKFINDYLPMCSHIASKFPQMKHHYDDMIQEGVLGIYDAKKFFDKSKGKFSSLAYSHIYRRISLYVRSNMNILKIAERDYMSLYKKRAFEHKFMDKHHRLPTNKEIQKELGFPTSLLRRVKFLESISFFETPCNLSTFDLRRDLGVFTGVYEALSCVLSEDERNVIEHYFGLNDEKSLTLAEIGKKLNCSHEKIRYIKNKALEKIKKEL